MFRISEAGLRFAALQLLVFRFSEAGDGSLLRSRKRQY
jgi:hypothetical protein